MADGTVSFILSKLAWWVVTPGVSLPALLILGLAVRHLARRGGWRRAGRAMAGVAAGGLLLAAVLPWADLLIVPLEVRVPPPAHLPDRVDGIVVLGGAENARLSRAWGQPVLGRAAERLIAFGALGRRYPEARMVYSGGSGDPIRQADRDAEVARMVFAQIGLDPDRVLYEERSRNTWENAVLSLAVARPQPGECWLLVSSAMSMPRGLGAFRRAGWPAGGLVPYPVDYRTRGEPDLWPRFHLGNGLEELTTGLRAWAGLLAYRAMGRTDALVPGPRSPAGSPAAPGPVEPGDAGCAVL